MPLDPNIAALLKNAAAIPPVDIHALTALEAALQLRARPAQALAPDQPARRVDNHVIAGPGGPIALRIYWPHCTGPVPACINFHGGGWVLGSIQADDCRNHAVAVQSGCAVVAVSYRLAPEHPFPAGLDDCYAAVCHVAREGAQLGLRTDRLGVSGSSAGGNLAAAVTLLARDRGGPELRAQFLCYPVCDDDFDRPSYLQNREGFGLSRAQMQWFWDQYVPPAQRGDARVAPVKGDLTGLPTAYILTAEYDPLRDEGETFARRLAEAGVEVTLQRVQGAIHGFILADPFMPISRKALAGIAAAMRHHLLDQSYPR